MVRVINGASVQICVLPAGIKVWVPVDGVAEEYPAIALAVSAAVAVALSEEVSSRKTSIAGAIADGDLVSEEMGQGYMPTYILVPFNEGPWLELGTEVFWTEESAQEYGK